MSTDMPHSRPGDPTWEIASLFPHQGDWTVSDYLGLSTNRPIELNDGKLEFLPMPTELHQLIVFYLCAALRNLGAGKPPGLALMSPFRVRVSPTKYREPDVIFMLNENRDRRSDRFWDGADLVVEVVSEDDPQRDLETKRIEYALAGIREYWIVDPRDRTIRVLTLELEATEYCESGCYCDGQTAASVLLTEFQVNVSTVFDQQPAQ
jgi:Uma2 family endonuclease